MSGASCGESPTEQFVGNFTRTVHAPTTRDNLHTSNNSNRDKEDMDKTQVYELEIATKCPELQKPSPGLNELYVCSCLNCSSRRQFSHFHRDSRLRLLLSLSLCKLLTHSNTTTLMEEQVIVHHGLLSVPLGP